MSRREEIEKLVGEENLELLQDVIIEAVFLEGKLDELKKYPFIKVHPKDPSIQKNTPASKMYKEFLQQYINCIKVIENVIYRDKRLENADDEESPLRKYFRERALNVNTK